MQNLNLNNLSLNAAFKLDELKIDLENIKYCTNLKL